jgi:trk system potassium uptake protein TrkH
MRYSNIIFTVGWGGIMLSAMMFLPFLWAIFGGDGQSGERFLVAILITSFVSGAFILSGRNVRFEKVRKSELFLVSLVLYLMLPFLACLPFISSGQGVGLWAAYFEAASALTTTGASIYIHPEFEPEALLLWRSLLGWFGGLLILTLSVAIIAPMGLFGIDLKPINIRQSEEEILPRRLRRSMRLIGGGYVLITLAGIVALVMTGNSVFNALSLTFSTISTTGFATTLAPLSAYISSSGMVVLCVLMLLGSLSYPAFILGLRFPLAAARKDLEIRQYVQLIFLLWLVLHFSVNTSTGDGQSSTLPSLLPPLLSELINSLATAISMLSTTALAINAPEQLLERWPAPVLFLPVIIGGMTLSTAGGIKVLRFSLLAKRIWYEIRNLPYPSSVEHMHYGERYVSLNQMMRVWGLFLVYLVGFAVSFMIGGLLTDNFDSAWLLALALLNNAGGVAVMGGQPELFAGLPPIGHILSSLMMILGRLEFMILLVLLMPGYWRSGN